MYVFDVLVDYGTNHLTDVSWGPDYLCGLLFSQEILNLDANNTFRDCNYVLWIADVTTNRSVSVAKTLWAVFSIRKQASTLDNIEAIPERKVGSWEGYNARKNAVREYSTYLMATNRAKS